MRNVASLIIATAILVIVAIGLWNQKDEAVSLAKRADQIEKTLLKPVNAPAAGEAELRGLADAISNVVTIGFGGFGAMGATDVRIALTANPDLYMTVDTLSVYGADPEVMKMTLVTEDWSDLRIADRIEAEGVEIFGIDTVGQALMLDMFSNQFTDNMGSEFLDDAPETSILEQLEPKVMPERSQLAVEKYAVRGEKLIMDGLTIHAPTVSSTLKMDDIWAAIARVSDLYRSISFDQVGMWDTDVAMDLNVQGSSINAEMGMEFVSKRGWTRGDLEEAIIAGFYSNSTMTMVSEEYDASRDEFVEIPRTDVNQSLTDYMGVVDFRLSGLLTSLTEQKLPDVTNTDVLSLGVWQIEGQADSFNDHNISTIEYMEMDLSHFHWLIPNNIGLKMKGFSLDVAETADYILDILDREGMDIGDDGVAMVDQIVTIFGNYDLDPMVTDFDMDFVWDPKNGDTSLTYDSALRNEIEDSFDLKLVLPTYNMMIEAPREDDGKVDVEALGPIFSDTTALSFFEYAWTDKGFLEKGFAITIDIAKLLPAEDMPQLMMITNQTPSGLRGMTSGLMRAGAGAMAGEFPPAVDFINAAASFIDEGGVLTLTVAPSGPMTAEDFTALGNLEPEEIVTTLGLKLTHESDENDTTDNEI